MATTTTAERGEPAPGSDRLRRTLADPALPRRGPPAGALIIVVFVWIVFAVIVSRSRAAGVLCSLDGTLNYLDVAAQVGIIGDGGRAADDRRRVRPVDRLARRLRRDRHRHLRDDLGPAGLAGDPHLDGADHAPRRHQRPHRRPHRPAVVHRHPGDAVHHPRRDARSLTAQITQHHLHPDRPGRRSRPTRSPGSSTGAGSRRRRPQGLDPVVDRASRSSASTSSAGPGSATGSPASAARRARRATSASRSPGSRSRCSP